MKDVVIIGGGIAGCMMAYHLRQAGADTVLVERHNTVAKQASGNPQGLVMPQLSLSQNEAADFNMRAYAAAVAFYEKCDIEKQKGILQFAVKESDLRFEKLNAHHNWPRNFCQKLDAGEAGDILGLSIHCNALWFSDALTLSPLQLCQFLSRDITAQFSTEALSLIQDSGGWIVKDKAGTAIAKAKSVVIANALDALAFPQTGHLKLRARRGQLSYIPANTESQKIRCSFTFGGYMTAAQNGLHVLGASYENPLPNPNILTETEHEKNLAKLFDVAPDLFSNVDVGSLKGRAAIRATTTDHRPIFGKVSEFENLFVLTGLGSRALTTAVFCAQSIVRQING